MMLHYVIGLSIVAVIMCWMIYVAVKHYRGHKRMTKMVKDAKENPRSFPVREHLIPQESILFDKVSTTLNRRAKVVYRKEGFVLQKHTSKGRGVEVEEEIFSTQHSAITEAHKFLNPQTEQEPTMFALRYKKGGMLTKFYPSIAELAEHKSGKIFAVKKSIFSEEKDISKRVVHNDYELVKRNPDETIEVVK